MPVIINGSTGVSGTDGSASTPAVQGTDSNTGMFFPAADTIAFAEGGVEAMRLNASGSVGIGTTAPNKSGSNVALTVNVASGQYGAIELSTGDVGRWYINADATNVYDTAMNNTNRTFYTGGLERVRITSGGDFQFNSGYGSVATAFGCRAWVNFNGTGTVAIRSSGNVSSITDLGTGAYRMNFTTSMPDANYSSVCTASDTGNWGTVVIQTVVSTASTEIYTLINNGTGFGDPGIVCAAFFR